MTDFIDRRERGLVIALLALAAVLDLCLVAGGVLIGVGGFSSTTPARPVLGLVVVVIGLISLLIVDCFLWAGYQADQADKRSAKSTSSAGR
jgi:arginine exporter protein ArgO